MRCRGRPVYVKLMMNVRNGLVYGLVAAGTSKGFVKHSSHENDRIIIDPYVGVRDHILKGNISGLS